MPPKKDLELDWRQMVRLPREWGEQIERMAHRRAITVAAMLRLLVREGMEQLDDDGQDAE